MKFTAKHALLNLEALTVYKIIYSDEDKSPGGRGKSLRTMARPERFDLPTFWFEARRSIQLS